MLYRIGAPVLATALLIAGAAEARMPSIAAKGDNAVPACATPGRLAAYLKSRNGELDKRFERIGVEYMRHGEALGLRWDYAFFQMLVETGNLTYTGDVDADQNNFAGIGATGGGEQGERFKSVSDGVKAHLQHLQMYAGVRVEDPVAERTRKVQEWRVLDGWRSKLRRDVTFTDMAGKWAPGSRGYPRDIESVAERFMSDFCNRPDPQPELVALARGDSARPVRQATNDTANTTGDEQPSGEELARRAGERARAEGDNRRSGLGAGAAAISGLRMLNGNNDAPASVPAESEQAAAAPPAVTPPAAQAPAGKALSAKAPTDNRRGRVEKAALTPPPATASGAAPSASASLPPAVDAPTQTAGKGCKVWTASYGGQKSVIIQSTVAAQANFTVLDVNDGREAREVEAYIQAYAKGGKKIADFPNSTAALEKAFELCPEN